ncbi:hypothetical protein BZG36_02224 [Bifiguratus adelaidae]|uniref:TM7S3/TM198-like domain-containing protein n=1 Tax=Bifiguratus adelaidae TaxID=1938954 RepID=A0A261Y3J9_9FUNG|nr:hypothetical protein BZG36_02224 [Bifiguratus adelaidae]
MRYQHAVIACLVLLGSVLALGAPLGYNPNNTGNEVFPSTIIFGISILLMGAFLNVFAYRYFSATMFWVGFCVFANITLISMTTSLPDTGENHRILLAIVAIVIGIIGGGLVLWCWPLGIAFLGALGGFYFSIWLLSWKSDSIMPTHTGIVTFLIIMTILGAASIFLGERIMILAACCMVGAYSSMFAISLWVGDGFSDGIYDFTTGHEANYQVTTNSYIFLALVLVFFLLGFMWQWNYHPGLFMTNRKVFWLAR